MPIAELPGATLHYARAGEGPPLLLIQGMSGTHLSWGRPFLDELERGFDCVVFDNRGVGRSPRVTEPFTIAELAEDAAALMDALGIERFHLVGISMGGMIAQELALAHARRVVTLTLGCTYCGGPGSRLTDPEDWQAVAGAWTSGDRERAIRAGWEFNLSEAFRSDERGFAAFREMVTQERAPLETVMQQLQAILAHDTHDRLPSVDVPAIVIHGTEDRVIPYSNGRMIAELMDVPLHTLEDVGHMFWWERPELSARLIREHTLAQTGASPA